jgi:hypothetical protein
MVASMVGLVLPEQGDVQRFENGFPAKLGDIMITDSNMVGTSAHMTYGQFRDPIRTRGHARCNSTSSEWIRHCLRNTLSPLCVRGSGDLSTVKPSAVHACSRYNRILPEFSALGLDRSALAQQITFAIAISSFDSRSCLSRNLRLSPGQNDGEPGR